MATIKQRFEHLGLAHNNKILMIVGIEVAKKVIPPLYQVPKILQKEGDNVFDVLNYPDEWNKEIDFEILNFLEHYLEKNKS